MTDWIATAKRKPTQADADPYGCVMAYHMMQGVMIIGWHVVGDGGYYTHWAHIPEAPHGAAEMLEEENRRLHRQYGCGLNIKTGNKKTAPSRPKQELS